MSNAAMKGSVKEIVAAGSRDDGGDGEASPSDAVRLARATESAVVKVRAQLEEIAKLMAVFVKVNAVFESVSHRLANATFKASVEATRGGLAPQAALVNFVEDLGELSKRAFDGTRDLRKELRAYASYSSATALALRQAETTLQELLGLLERMRESGTRTPSASPSGGMGIEIENRMSPMPPPPPGAALAPPSSASRGLAGALAKAFSLDAWTGDPPKTGGYKN